MSPRVQRVAWARGDASDALVTREWLVTNGLGGYASGTLGGVSARRFHGLLVAALPAPLGRTMILNRLDETLLVQGHAPEPLEGVERPGGPPEQPRALAEVRFEDGLPVWLYEAGSVVLEKRVFMAHGRNTTYVTWSLRSSPAAVRLRIHPGMHVRPHEGAVARDPRAPYRVEVEGSRWLVHTVDGVPPVEMLLVARDSRMTVDAMELPEQLYLVEQRRGYDSVGSLCSPGAFEVVLAPGEEATLIVTVEDAHQRGAPRPPVEALAREIARRAALIDAAAPALREGVAGELVLASDAFLIYPAARYEPTHQGEPRARTIIAGYPWFTDWGRDTMISLEGLALVTGRHVEAGAALRMFARHVRDGLIPNLFPESRGEGLYHTADATLWFFHAVDRYVTIARDRETLRHLLPTLEDIVTHHVRGTRFGIHVDPGDELLSQGAPGLQLTWMDAKVDGWVVTPRRGKAVEINALWYNALCLLAGWLLEEGHASRAHEVLERASRVRASFNLRFWSDRHGHLFDVVDGEGGDDGSLRPNQILALSLPNPVLVEPRWMAVLHAVRDALLTPVGLRSLAPTERAYEARYDGDLRARDAAYHQGTVWAWLAGPFVDAWLRVHPADVAGAREALVGFAGHIGEGAIGFISEIFDAEPPFTPRGCTAQAWSVAEVLRVWAKTHEPQPPR